MDKTGIIIIVIVSALVLALLIFVTWKNKKDRKALNPDATDAMEETMTDQQRNKERD